MGFKTYENLSIICCTTESEEAWVYSLCESHKLLCMHVYKDLTRCKSVCDVISGIDPFPSLSRSCNRWWLDFVTFAALRNVKTEGDFPKKKSAIRFEQVQRFIWRKIYFGFGFTLIMSSIYIICSLNHVISLHQSALVNAYNLRLFTCATWALFSSMEICCCFCSQVSGSRCQVNPCVLALKKNYK